MKSVTYSTLELIFTFFLCINLVYADQYGETATCTFSSQTDLTKEVFGQDAHKDVENNDFFNTSIKWNNDKGKVTIFFGNKQPVPVHVDYSSDCPSGAKIESLTGIFNNYKYTIKLVEKPSVKNTFHSIWEAQFTNVSSKYHTFNGEMECRITYKVYDSSSLESKTCKEQDPSRPNAACTCIIS